MTLDKTVLLEILDRVVRSWWTIVAGICLGTSCAVAAMHYLPKIYETRTTIFVAPQRIPQDIVRTTVVDDMSLRMAALAQAVLSRPYLERLIASEFKPAPTTEEEAERLVRLIRSKVTVRVSSGVFEIAYRDGDPERAARVVNTLADLYIQENSRYRTERAGETTKTLREFATRVRTDLEAQERRIAEFRAAHLYETADRQQATLQMMATRRKDLESKEAELADAREAIRVLAEMETQAEAFPVTPATKSPASGGARVAALEREIKNLKLRYSDEHPQVKAKQRELDEVRASIRADADAAPAPTIPSSSLQDDSMKGQREAMQNQVHELEAGVQKIRAEIAMYEKRIENTPQIELQLSELSKGYDVLLGQYNGYQSKVESARSSQEIEEARKGEQFEMMEKAVPPSLPVQPVPLVVFGFGIAGGLALCVGPLLVRAIGQPLISSESGLRVLSPDVPVLVNIPRIQIPATVQLDGRRRWTNIGLSVASAAILVVTVIVLG
jgi:polysaccharide chain length determinant protein (PEP-CTERM system associated)